MPAESLLEIVGVTGGTLVGNGADRRPTGYSIDSRTVSRGDLFFAIVGSKQDGHRYVSEASRKGAAAVVVSDVSAIPSGVDGVVVRDTTRALQDLAAARRRRCAPKVIGITGSSGKTTTKEMTRAVLETSFKVMASKGNLNNLFGLPLSLLQLDERHQVAVLEMGMSTHGELTRLAEIADPDVGVLTNVYGAHLEFFEDVDDYARAKAELFHGMRPGTTGIFNSDDPRSRRIAADFRGRRFTFGAVPPCDFAVTAYAGEGFEGSTFELQHAGRKRGVRLRYAGAHQSLNAAAALAAGVALGCDLDLMIRRLATLEPQEMRGRAHELRDGMRLLDDSYNANPAAMKATLELLSQTEPRGTGRRVAVLGDMLELGGESIERHRDVGRLLVSCRVGAAWVVGPLMSQAARSAREAGFDAIATAATAEEVIPLILDGVKPGDVILIKGSRGIGLDRVTRALVESAGGTRASGGRS